MTETEGEGARPEGTREVTRLLAEIDRGGPQRAEELLPLVYDELRSLARARMAHERPGQTLQATSLVHEAYLRLIGDQDPGWNGRGHFFGAAARAMRRILVEQARRKGRVLDSLAEQVQDQELRAALSQVEAELGLPTSERISQG